MFQIFPNNSDINVSTSYESTFNIALTLIGVLLSKFILMSAVIDISP